MSSEAIKDGSVVSVHYKGTLDDGTEFDSSHTRGEPMTFQMGGGQVIPGFESAALGMVTGESKTFTLAPTEAYGVGDPNAIQPVPTSHFPEGFEFQVGGIVQGENPDGGAVMATINAVDGDTVILDFNHPMAGKNLTFEIEIVDVGESMMTVT